MAFRDLFRNYYYGKPGKKDFTEEDLPENRFQLFWQVFGVRKGNMVGLNLLYLLVWLPAILWSTLNFLQIWQQLTEGTDWLQLRQVIFTWLLLLWPLVALTGPFNAGISLVMHRWAQDEHSFPYTDFGLGIKGNWKQGLFYGVIEGAAPLLVFLCIDFYMQLSASSPLFLLPLMIICMVGMVWFLASPLVPQLLVSYKQGFLGILRNAMLMALAQLLRCIAVRLLTLLIPILALLSVLFFPGALRWITLIGSLLYGLILLSFNKLIWASFTNYLGEKYLNSKIPGAPTDIGLRPKKEQ